MTPFQKMHGTANDFVVVADQSGGRREWSSIAVAACDRRLGIGADGLLLVQHSERADLRMRLFNADGSEAEMCSNRIRCAAKFALDTGLTRAESLTMRPARSLVGTEILERGEDGAMVRVDMGPPQLDATAAPVGLGGASLVEREVDIEGWHLTLACLSMGNPHAVAFVDSVAAFPLGTIGPLVEHHPAFPDRTGF